ncbi:MAG: amidase family protein, partial [Desulfobacterales bacterium]
MDELVSYDAVGLSRLIREGEITPIELLEITIQRIEKVNPKLNAIIHKLYDEARTVAANINLGTKAKKAKDSVFCGIPFLLKNLIAECKGTPFNEGSLAVQGYISKVDSEIVKRHKASGLIIVGKTNTPEFG